MVAYGGSHKTRFPRLFLLLQITPHIPFSHCHQSHSSALKKFLLQTQTHHSFLLHHHHHHLIFIKFLFSFISNLHPVVCERPLLDAVAFFELRFVCDSNHPHYISSSSDMSSLSKSFRLSSTLKIEEAAMVGTKNQGIGSILGSDTCDERNSANSSSSLRRTLSAEHMSSTKWLTQHGFSPMKKIASSEEFSICSIADSSSSEDEEDSEETNDDEPRSQFDIWSSIQEEVSNKKEQGSQFDIWSSIIQQKSQEITDNKPLAPPYIHPLVKRSASSLSEKSLEICTESLGSETGSEGFSSYPASESGDDDKETEHEQQERVEQGGLSFAFEAISIPKYNYAAGKKSPAQQRSFPPPIPSRGNGASSIRMQSRRDNGRLVLEAVSVPSTNNFLAQRQDGRLVLTFVDSAEEVRPEIEQDEVKETEEMEEEFENFDDDDDEYMESEDEDEAEEEEEEKEGAFVMEQAPPKLLSSRVIHVHRLSSLMGLANRDPAWPNKFNEVVKFDEVENDIKPTIVAKSLPPMPRMIPKARAVAEGAGAGTVTTAAVVATARGRGGGGCGGGVSFNAYEYYWRPKSPMSAAQSKGGCGGDDDNNNNDNNHNKKLILSKNSMGRNNNQERQQLLVLRGNKGDYWVPMVKSCKEPRRSLLFLEPYCIATS